MAQALEIAMKADLYGVKVKKAKGSSGSRKADVDGEDQPFKLTWTRNASKVPFKPDGRKCRLCSFKDSDQDPVSKATLHTLHLLIGFSIESLSKGYSRESDGTVSR